MTDYAKIQRSAAFWMVALQTAVAAYMLDKLAIPLAVLCIVPVGRLGGLRRPARFMLAMLLVVAVSLMYGLFRPPGIMGSILFREGFGFGIVQYFVMWQAIELFLRDPRDLPPALPLYGTIVLACLGSAVVSRTSATVYAVAAIGFVALTGAFFTCSRAKSYVIPPQKPGRHLALSTVLVAVALGLGWGMGAVIYRYRNELDAALFGTFMGQLVSESLGFQTNPKLGSVAKLKQNEQMQTALYVVSERAPGYLKARAYDHYEKGRWQSTVGQAKDMGISARPSQIPASVAPQENVFVVPGDHGPRWQGLEIWPNMFDGGSVFTRMGGAALVVDCPQVGLDGLDNLVLLQRRGNEIYRVYLPDGDIPRLRQKPSAELRELLTAVPKDLDPRIRQLASRLLEGKDRTTAKILAVVRYFNTNYQYDLGIKVPEGQDPLTYFFTERPAAHCEYFATGAAILLRLGDVPCRYVTGFVVDEKNPLGDHWLGRNRDAHAWGEAYDEARGWTTVEATAAEGVPGAAAERKASLTSYLWDSLRLSHEQRRGAFKSEGIKGFARRVGGQALSLVRRAISKTTGLVVVLCLAAYLSVRYLRRRGTSKPFRPDPALAALHRSLAHMDRSLAARGLTREPSETLHQFAGRIEQEDPVDNELREAAAWYVTYAGARYGQAPAERQVAGPPRLPARTMGK